MTELLAPEPGDRVLEVGTGYAAAELALEREGAVADRGHEVNLATVAATVRTFRSVSRDVVPEGHRRVEAVEDPR